MLKHGAGFENEPCRVTQDNDMDKGGATTVKKRKTIMERRAIGRPVRIPLLRPLPIALLHTLLTCPCSFTVFHTLLHTLLLRTRVARETGLKMSAPFMPVATSPGDRQGEEEAQKVSDPGGRWRRAHDGRAW